MTKTTAKKKGTRGGTGSYKDINVKKFMEVMLAKFSEDELNKLFQCAYSVENNEFDFTVACGCVKVFGMEFDYEEIVTKAMSASGILPKED